VVRFAERFVLERELGSGGMSWVFLGRDEVLDRPVAVKVLKPGFGETDIGARFRREGRTAARLSHPNIVQVYDAGEGEFEGRETSYIVMEYVPGGDLKRLIDRRGVLSGGELIKLSEVAAGLAHAHERGVIHRDIKPHNILLDETGSLKLTDFGIARALDATQATRTGSYLGTALYSPPEQLRGEGVAPKSDVYSLGVTLYHAATGQPPFSGNPIEIASQHVSKEPTPPRQVNDAVSESLEALILDCMRKAPDARPSADEVRLRLLEAGRGTHAYPEPPAAVPAGDESTRAPTAATRLDETQRPPGGAVYTGRQDRRRGALAILALVAVLALIGAIAAATLLGGGDRTANVPEQNGGNPSGDQAQGEQNQQQGEQPTSRRRSPGQVGGGPTEEEAAAQTVRDVYATAAAGDYGASYELLSERLKQSAVPTLAEWSGQFNTLQSIRFIQGPSAQVSGNTATVTGTTIAQHTDRTERNTATWTLVNEGGEWKLDSINILRRELI
jgi:eukaryotic-like serine/threonine-protein kinase